MFHSDFLIYLFIFYFSKCRNIFKRRGLSAEREESANPLDRTWHRGCHVTSTEPTPSPPELQGNLPLSRRAYRDLKPRSRGERNTKHGPLRWGSCLLVAWRGRGDSKSREDPEMRSSQPPAGDWDRAASADVLSSASALGAHPKAICPYVRVSGFPGSRTRASAAHSRGECRGDNLLVRAPTRGPSGAQEPAPVECLGVCRLETLRNRVKQSLLALQCQPQILRSLERVAGPLASELLSPTSTADRLPSSARPRGTVCDQQQLFMAGKVQWGPFGAREGAHITCSLPGLVRLPPPVPTTRCSWDTSLGLHALPLHRVCGISE